MCSDSYDKSNWTFSGHVINGQITDFEKQQNI